MIIALRTPAEKEGKRHTAVLDNGKRIHFGLKGGQTYLDHKDKVKRFNYWKRHYGNEKERKLILVFLLKLLILGGFLKPINALISSIFLFEFKIKLIIFFV